MSQLLDRVGNAPSCAVEIGVGSLSGKVARAAEIAKTAPEDQPTELDWRYFDEAAEILPDKWRTTVA